MRRVNYFRVMKMTRSYKPVLILATLQSDGSITVERAAEYFVKFYRRRMDAGLRPEVGSCIYADSSATRGAIINNLVTNPVNALCGSGFFEYDAVCGAFSFAGDIYDGLSLDEIDEISRLCHLRLDNYFKER